MVMVIKTKSRNQFKYNGICGNIRNWGETNSSVICKGKNSENLDVYEEKNSWLRISDRECIFYDVRYVNYND